MTNQPHIAIIAPAGFCNPVELANIQRRLLTLDPIHYHFMPSCIHALSPRDRVAEIIELIEDDSIDAIWTLRGGEGSSDLLPYLSANQHRIKRGQPKPIIGFSDITALLLYFSQQLGWPVIHGPCIIQYANPAFDQNSRQIMQNLLCQNQHEYTLALQPLNQAAYQPRSFQSMLTGGNATMVNLSLSDIHSLQPDGKIIILEDVNEKPHAIRRTLQHLKRTKRLEQVRAMILGNFADNIHCPNNNPWQQDIHETIKEFALSLACPVLHTQAIGHGATNIAFQYQTLATCQLGSSPYLQLQTL